MISVSEDSHDSNTEKDREKLNTNGQILDMTNLSSEAQDETFFPEEIKTVKERTNNKK